MSDPYTTKAQSGEPERAIPHEMQLLRKAIDQVWERLAELQQKISPVCNSTPREGESDKTEPLGPPLAADIHKSALDVAYIARDIKHLTDSVEL
jgi:hypothetical protein